MTRARQLVYNRSSGCDARLRVEGTVSAEVLILAANPERAMGLCEALVAQGYSVTLSAWNPESWLEEVEASTALLVVLWLREVADVSIESLTHLSDTMVDLPRLVVIGGGDVADRVRALNAGADACLVSEVSRTELMARLVALMRRAPFRGDLAQLSEGSLSLDLTHQAVAYRGRRLKVSQYEFRVLRDLALRVMECRSHFPSGEGDDRLVRALVHLRDYADGLELQSRHLTPPTRRAAESAEPAAD